MKETFNKKPYKVISPIPFTYVRYSFTRPNDTTAYAAYDAVADSTSAPTLFTLSGLDKGIIMTAKLATGKTGGTIPVGSFKVRLFNAPITPVNDNAAIAMLWANKTKGFADIDFTLAGGGTGSDSASSKVQNLNIINNWDTVYFMIESVGAYTPVALQEFYLELGMLTN